MKAIQTVNRIVEQYKQKPDVGLVIKGMSALVRDVPSMDGMTIMLRSDDPEVTVFETQGVKKMGYGNLTSDGIRAVMFGGDRPETMFIAMFLVVAVAQLPLPVVAQLVDRYIRSLDQLAKNFKEDGK